MKVVVLHTCSVYSSGWNTVVALFRLYEVASKALAVPAISAAVEGVLRCDGMFMRPHRSRLTNKMLPDLMFLKSETLKSATAAPLTKPS